MIRKNSRIVITGGGGFLGGHVVKTLRLRGYRNLFIPRSQKFDLRYSNSCKIICKNADVIIHLAATVGGIGFNQKYPANLFYDNLLMGVQLLHEAYTAQVKKFVAIGTICAYPKYTPVPFREEDLWNGYPEETNAFYGLAKKMLLVGCQAYRRQYGFNGIYLLPVNLYGPYDNFHPENSHVVPALIDRIHAAKINRQKEVTIWGSGNASREFLYVADAAKAIVLAMEAYDKSDPINIGSGQEITIKDLVKKIIKLVGFPGKVIWDKTKPDGQPRRLLSVDSAYREFKFRSQTDLDTGLRKTYQWYLKNMLNEAPRHTKWDEISADPAELKSAVADGNVHPQPKDYRGLLQRRVNT